MNEVDCRPTSDVKATQLLCTHVNTGPRISHGFHGMTRWTSLRYSGFSGTIISSPGSKGIDV